MRATKSKKLIGASSLLVLMIPFNASADEYDKIGLYIGVSGGIENIKASKLVDKTVTGLTTGVGAFATATASMQQTNGAYKAFAGYNINKNFAVEAFYAGLGNYDFTINTTGPIVNSTGQVKVNAYGIDLLVKIPVNDGFSVYGRVGYFQTKVKIDITATGITTVSGSITDNLKSNVKFGLGSEYAFNEDISVRTDWEYYNDKDTPINVLSVGLVANF